MIESVLGAASLDDLLWDKLSKDRPAGVAWYQSQQEERDEGDPDHDGGNLEEAAQQKGEQDRPAQGLGKAGIPVPAVQGSAQRVAV